MGAAMEIKAAFVVVAVASFLVKSGRVKLGRFVLSLVPFPVAWSGEDIYEAHHAVKADIIRAQAAGA